MKLHLPMVILADNPQILVNLLGKKQIKLIYLKCNLEKHHNFELKKPIKLDNYQNGL